MTLTTGGLGLGGGVHGFVICWIIIWGLRPVACWGRRAMRGCNSLVGAWCTCKA